MLSERRDKPKWLKTVGATLLLLAFGLQMRQGQLAAVARERTDAAELSGRAVTRALGYENLYYSSKSAGFDRPDYLKDAALQYFEGRSAMMATSPEDRAEVTDELGDLAKAARDVKDLSTFNDFLTLHDEIRSHEHSKELSGLIEPSRYAEALGSFYLGMYFIGSIIVILGQALDPVK